MNVSCPGDDPELRRLLDAIGLRDEATTVELSAAEVERAERMLAYVTNERQDDEREPHRDDRRHRAVPKVRWALGLVGATAVCVLAGILVAVQPWGGHTPAYAQTPAMLQFSDVRAGHIKQSGEPAVDVLGHMATRAADLPEPADHPVQHLELEGWWASSAPPEGTEAARTILTSVRDSHYLMPNDDLRSIERRGEPIDADGHLSTVGFDVQHAVMSDEIFTLDPEHGSRHLETLPGTVEGLAKTLAPPEDCAEIRGSCLLNAVVTLFETHVVPPALASLLWEVLATEPTITSLGTTTGRLGGAAVVLTAPSVNGTEQLLVLIDPVSGRYVGSELILIASSDSVGFDPPAVLSLTYVVKAERIPLADVPDESTATRY